ncbi:thiamine phosphate synthase [Hahella sp. SMD15-11]|uniref:Thiamine phosphate synthase n=1 Tax=Thermohahella caldifontis TaxID=3142973 RepID=A0AB39V195_9GAMM
MRPLFPSATKPEAPPASLDVLRSARRTLACPVAAIGGITPERTRRVLEAGADLVVVSGALFGAASAEEVCRRAGVFVSEIESWFGEVS